jgi:F0F1-type ATP synthase membrane subunit c/vacuolar-type H+-ATPase subunit K
VLHLFIWVGLFAGFTGGDPDAMIWGVIVGLINGIGAGIYVANGVDAILEQLRLSQPDREQEEEEINIK